MLSAWIVIAREFATRGVHWQMEESPIDQGSSSYCDMKIESIVMPFIPSCSGRKPPLLVTLLVGVGDYVTEGSGIAEIETAKATIEMESFFEGKVVKVHARVGDEVYMKKTVIVDILVEEVL